MKNKVKISVVIAVFGWCSFGAYAWENKLTHPRLTEKAIFNNNQSVLDEYIKQQLGIAQGLNGILLLDQSTMPEPNRIPPDQFEERIFPELSANPCTILDFLKAGAHLEDVPLPRARHHFHDPIRNAGTLNILGE